MKMATPPPQKKPRTTNFSCSERAPFVCPETFQQGVPELKRWEPNEPTHRLPPGFFLILEGSRRIGKSEFMKWLLFNYRNDFDLVIVMTETPHNGFWQPIVGNLWVHNGWNPILMRRLLDSQNKLKEEEVKRNAKPRRVLIVLDDIIGERKIHDDSLLSRLATQGRHFNISVCLATQDAKAIHPVLRNNCDVCVIFHQKNTRSKEAVWHDFLGAFADKRLAMDILNRYTQNHDCIVVENHKLGAIPEMLYFWVPGDMVWNMAKNAPITPRYQMGCDEQIRLAKTKNGSTPIFSH